MDEARQMVDAVIRMVDAIADTRGVQRCEIITQAVNMLGRLRERLTAEEQAFLKAIDEAKGGDGGAGDRTE